ncbi:hypothetical protein FSP39_000909 [Pinctada imbricata]|uniref:Uncharacterized protein n=1 Tax=Pinctada imbricata TaxID=66713 RepID=A0AA89BN77_PINIB|nr:hypothetical protein FSP39_000909 [Pinctada imbricata]
MNSKSGLKYIVERNESEVDESDIEDEGLVIESFSDRFREGHYHHKNKSDGSSFVKSKTDSAVSLKNRLNSQNGDVSQKDFGQLADQENVIQDVRTGKNYSHISPHCKVGGFKDKNGCGHSIKVKMDINRNTCCKVENSKVQHIPVETRCCSLV